MRTFDIRKQSSRREISLDDKCGDAGGDGGMQGCRGGEAERLRERGMEGWRDGEMQGMERWLEGERGRKAEGEAERLREEDGEVKGWGDAEVERWMEEK